MFECDASDDGRLEAANKRDKGNLYLFLFAVDFLFLNYIIYIISKKRY